MKTFDLRKIGLFKDLDLPWWERFGKKDPEKYTGSEIVLRKVTLNKQTNKQNSVEGEN